MKIGILGTRGIPNNYGGFEQFAEFLAVGLSEKGHEVCVYNSHNHIYQESTWNNINIIHCFDPEDRIGTIGQFIYDLNCIRNSRKQNFDIILQLGYTSSSVWWWLLPFSKSRIITNMDGLEWMRSKYTPMVRFFLKSAEKLGAIHSDVLVADSTGIKKHLKNKYLLESHYIPYGANIPESTNHTDLAEFNLQQFDYDMLIARMEPENNIEAILDGYVKSLKTRTFLVIGNMNTKFGIHIKNKFEGFNIKFVGAIYDINKLNTLRYFSNLYFHGHSVGGTNPSLLEAMASSCLICAHKNMFNQSILTNDAFYFENSTDVATVINESKKSNESAMINANLIKIRNTYSWSTIINQYEDLFKSSL
ncbi:MAG: glycosyltransferase involved in cell wall biosynthesis [Parvicella sp.]|jgi:glycosyltransferase involved in cell wall biosynthesis